MGYNVTKDEDDGKLNELVEMIDKLIASGDGHLNVSIDENKEGISVHRFSASDCGTGKTACCQPTEKAIDDKEDI